MVHSVCSENPYGFLWSGGRYVCIHTTKASSRATAEPGETAARRGDEKLAKRSKTLQNKSNRNKKYQNIVKRSIV